MAIKISPWQEQLLVDIKSGGFKPGEMFVMMSSRQTGKSQLAAYARLFNDIYAQRPIEDLILSEGKVHGARYHCVEPVGGNWKDMEAWCKECFGEPGDMWESSDWCWPEAARWLQNNRKFWFRNERDRTVFIMRWSR